MDPCKGRKSLRIFPQDCVTEYPSRSNRVSHPARTKSWCALHLCCKWKLVPPSPGLATLISRQNRYGLRRRVASSRQDGYIDLPRERQVYYFGACTSAPAWIKPESYDSPGLIRGLGAQRWNRASRRGNAARIIPPGRSRDWISAFFRGFSGRFLEPLVKSITTMHVDATTVPYICFVATTG